MAATPLPKFPYGVIQCSPHGRADLLAEIRELLTNRTLAPRTILCVNAHIYNMACEDARLSQDLSAARVVAADGMAIVWTASWFGGRVRERCNMTEVFRAFLEAKDMPRTRAILIGCPPAEAEAARLKINAMSTHCQVVQSVSGFLSDADYRRILTGRGDLDFVFLGMGTPRTETFAHLASALCPQAIVWTIGGGTVMIYAGKEREAPVLWRRLGIQWLYRLITRPGPFWRRYVFGNPRFLARLVRQAWRRRRDRR